MRSTGIRMAAMKLSRPRRCLTGTICLITALIAVSSSAFSLPTALQKRRPLSSVAPFVISAKVHPHHQAITTRLRPIVRGGNNRKNYNDFILKSHADRNFSSIQSAGIVTFPFVVLTKAVLASALAFLKILVREIRTLTLHQKVFFLATFIAGFAVGRNWQRVAFWKRFTDVNDIPNAWFGSSAPLLRGRAVSVSDGDTIRFLHQPTRFHPAAIRKEQTEKTSTTALAIRLCTIDTPETAKFGKPGQPFGDKAKEYLTSLLDNKVVRVRLLQKDQYGRAVAEVFTTQVPFVKWFRKYADAQMLEAGLAEVYLGGGAVYGPLGKDAYLDLQDKAQNSKKGIWAQRNRESAAEYKKRTK